ncbi:hypothetical protein K7432_016740 [Basidiobolus ranarum]|uniref:MYND-type domain-containing protein n=1 Tax=Basidiobolus ranarum TaxID=34480 RepID=A0ABR2WE99_9FUNG
MTVVVKEKETLSALLKEKLQIQLSIQSAPVEAPVKAVPIPKSSQSKCYVCGTGLLKRFCCSYCKAVKYCGRGCQIKDWEQHKKLCSLLKKTMEKYKELGEFPFTFTKEGYFSEDSNLAQHEALKSFYGEGFWREEFLEGLACPMKKAECKITDPVELCGISSTLLPFDKPFGKYTGFANTPKAIHNWADLYKAKEIRIF